MTDETKAQVAHTFTEAPASWNARYFLNGFECMLTLRGDNGAELLPRTIAALDWLKEHGAVAQRQNGNAPAPVAQPIPAPAQAGTPPPVPVALPPSEAVETEVIQVKAVCHAVTEGGVAFVKVKGGKYSKYGVKAWPEVVPQDCAFESWATGTEFQPPANMAYAVVQDGKKVVAFRATEK